MEDYRRGYVPGFGSWDCYDDVPFTECFESARQAAGLLRYSYSEDRDLYVSGDVYENDCLTPAMIPVPRPRKKVGRPLVKATKEQRWESDEKEQASPTSSPLPRRPTPKPVDQDLYTISPDLLYSKSKKKRGLGFFSSCFLPVCVS